MKYNKVTTVYRKLLYITAFIMLIGIMGCATTRIIKINPPKYPSMNCVRVDKEGGLTPEETKKVQENMLRLQELVDELYLCPCYRSN